MTYSVCTCSDLGWRAVNAVWELIGESQGMTTCVAAAKVLMKLGQNGFR